MYALWPWATDLASCGIIIPSKIRLRGIVPLHDDGRHTKKLCCDAWLQVGEHDTMMTLSCFAQGSRCRAQQGRTSSEDRCL